MFRQAMFLIDQSWLERVIVVIELGMIPILPLMDEPCIVWLGILGLVLIHSFDIEPRLVPFQVQVAYHQEHYPQYDHHHYPVLVTLLISVWIHRYRSRWCPDILILHHRCSIPTAGDNQVSIPIAIWLGVVHKGYIGYALRDILLLSLIKITTKGKIVFILLVLIGLFYT